MQLVALEYLPSIEGAAWICRTAPFCGKIFCICRHPGLPLIGEAIGLSLFSPPPIQRRQPVQAEVVEEEEGEAEGGGGPEEGGGGG